MAILNIKQKIEPYVKTATGYVKQLLSADHVIMDGGKTLQEAWNENTSSFKSNFKEDGSNKSFSISLYNGKIKIYMGSLVTKVANKNYTFLFSKDELVQIFNSPAVDQYSLLASTWNGDYKAVSQSFPSPVWWQDQSTTSSTGIYQYFPEVINNKSVRINYFLLYTEFKG